MDLAIDALVPVNDNVLHQKLEQNNFVVLARKNHPIVKSTLALTMYLEQEHVLVSSRSTGPSIEDFELSRIGLQRKIGLRCQHPFSACRVIAGNDMLLTLTESNANMYSQLLDLAIYPLPVKLP